jgi:hypothetical protein
MIEAYRQLREDIEVEFERRSFLEEEAREVATRLEVQRQRSLPLWRPHRPRPRPVRIDRVVIVSSDLDSESNTDAEKDTGAARRSTQEANERAEARAIRRARRVEEAPPTAEKCVPEAREWRSDMRDRRVLVPIWIHDS